VSHFKDITELGEIGEELVYTYMVSRGNTVAYSENPFDSTKDLIVNGEFVEVKTQCRNRPPLNCFSTQKKPTNLQKCMEVKFLLFVEFDDSDTLRIWTPIDRNHFTDYQANTKDGPKQMRGWYIEPNEIGPGCKCVAEFNLPQMAKRMKALSPSQFYGKHKKSTTYSTRPH